MALRLFRGAQPIRNCHNAKHRAVRYIFPKLALCFHTHNGFVFLILRISESIVGRLPHSRRWRLSPLRVSSLQSQFSQFTIQVPPQRRRGRGEDRSPPFQAPLAHPPAFPGQVPVGATLFSPISTLAHWKAHMANSENSETVFFGANRPV